MTSIKKTLFVGTSLFVSILSLSQVGFAQQKDNETLTLQELDAAFITPLKSTSAAIQNDIDTTKTQIQKITDPSLQGVAIRDLLLRIVGRMSSYTIAECNMYLIFFQSRQNLIPYALIKLPLNERTSGDIETPWFEYMKDPKNVPAFNDPVSLIEDINKNFNIISDKSLKAALAIETVIIHDQKSGSDPKTPDKNSPEIKSDVVKYLLHRRHSPQTSI